MDVGNGVRVADVVGSQMDKLLQTSIAMVLEQLAV
jgi:hypothetical protein